MKAGPQLRLVSTAHEWLSTVVFLSFVMLLGACNLGTQNSGQLAVQPATQIDGTQSEVGGDDLGESAEEVPNKTITNSGGDGQGFGGKRTYDIRLTRSLDPDFFEGTLPLALSLTLASDGRPTLFWNLDESLTAKLKGFVIEVAPEASVEGEPLNWVFYNSGVSPELRSFVIDGLEPRVAYYFRVFALSTSHYSSTSNVVSNRIILGQDRTAIRK